MNTDQITLPIRIPVSERNAEYISTLKEDFQCKVEVSGGYYLITPEPGHYFLPTIELLLRNFCGKS